MLRFSKMSLLVVFCGVAILVAPPAAHAASAIELKVNGNSVGTLNEDGSEITFSGTVQVDASTTATLNLRGETNAVSINARKGDLNFVGSVTFSASTTTPLVINVSATNYPQPLNMATLTGSGTINGGTVISETALTGVSTVNPRLTNSFSIIGSGSTTITNTKPPYSMAIGIGITNTQSSSFTFDAKLTPSN